MPYINPSRYGYQETAGGRKAPPDFMAWLQEAVLYIVRTTYENYYAIREYNPHAPEPMISQAYIRVWLAQGSTPASDDHPEARFHWELLWHRRQNTALHSALQRLVRQGKLERSLGMGLRRHARVYAPAGEWSDA